MSDLPNNSDESLDKSIIELEDEANDRLRQARKYMLNDNDEQALALVTQVIREDKENTDALWMYARLQTNDDKAKSALKQLVKVDPTHEKARKMLNRLESRDQQDLDLFGNGSSSLQPNRIVSGGDSLERERLELERQRLEIERERMRSQATQQPIINIHNSATANPTVNQNTNVGAVGIMKEERNKAAFVVGIIGSIFFGIFGLAHILNGKILAGFGHMLLGFIWIGIFLTLVSATAGIGALIALPLHIWFGLRNSRKGAARTVIV